MKTRILSLLFVTLCVISCGSGRKAKAPDKLDKFVEKAEMSATRYSEEDWATSKEEYEALIEEYYAHEDEYTSEEKARAMKAIGRYHALLLVNGVSEAASLIDSFKRTVPSYLEGLEEVFKESGDEMKDLFKGLFDTKELDSAFKDLMEALSGMMSGASSELEGLFEDYEDLLDDYEDILEDIEDIEDVDDEDLLEDILEDMDYDEDDDF